MWKSLLVPLVAVTLLGDVASTTYRPKPVLAHEASEPTRGEETTSAHLPEGHAKGDDGAFWRGKRPRFCAVDTGPGPRRARPGPLLGGRLSVPAGPHREAQRCPSPRPTFCLVESPDRGLPRIRERDHCDRELGVRDARHRVARGLQHPRR